MNLKSRIEGNDVLVVELLAESLDAGNVPQFRDAVQDLIGESRRVVLDLAAVKFVDSSGLGALLACLRQVNGRKGAFRLCAPSQTVRALIELTRMHRVFTIDETRDEAVRAFA